MRFKFMAGVVQSRPVLLDRSWHDSPSLLQFHANPNLAKSAHYQIRVNLETFAIVFIRNAELGGAIWQRPQESFCVHPDVSLKVSLGQNLKTAIALQKFLAQRCSKKRVEGMMLAIAFLL